MTTGYIDRTFYIKLHPDSNKRTGGRALSSVEIPLSSLSLPSKVTRQKLARSHDSGMITVNNTLIESLQSSGAWFCWLT